MATDSAVLGELLTELRETNELLRDIVEVQRWTFEMDQRVAETKFQPKIPLRGPQSAHKFAYRRHRPTASAPVPGGERTA